MVFKTLYDFNVLDEINAGNKVYMIDRLAGDISVVNDMSVREYASFVNRDNADNRIEFYVSEKEKENETI